MQGLNKEKKTHSKHQLNTVISSKAEILPICTELQIKKSFDQTSIVLIVHVACLVLLLSKDVGLTVLVLII